MRGGESVRDKQGGNMTVFSLIKTRENVVEIGRERDSPCVTFGEFLSQLRFRFSLWRYGLRDIFRKNKYYHLNEKVLIPPTDNTQCKGKGIIQRIQEINCMLLVHLTHGLFLT
jgi:hypothetical protein